MGFLVAAHVSFVAEDPAAIRTLLCSRELRGASDGNTQSKNLIFFWMLNSSKFIFERPIIVKGEETLITKHVIFSFTLQNH